MLETTIRQRLDAAKCVFSADSDRTYRAVLALHHQSVGILGHLIKVAGQPAKGLHHAPMMLTTLWLEYSAKYREKGVLVDLGHPSTGVSVHFLEWAESRLPGGAAASNLLRLIKGSLAGWRAANPGVVPEAAGAGYCAV